jgi:hypothetical protein
MAEKVVIVGTRNEIVAINPETSMRIPLKNASQSKLKVASYNENTLNRRLYDILDVQPTRTSIYHASEVQEEILYKAIDGTETGNLVRGFVNYAQVYNTLNGKCTLTIKNVQTAAEKRLYLDEMDFRFMPSNGSLFYEMKMTPYNPILKRGNPFNPGLIESGMIFHNIAGSVHCNPQKASFEGGKVYYDDRKIASMNGSVKTLHEISIREFEHMLRANNKEKFEKNKAFFRPKATLK